MLYDSSPDSGGVEIKFENAEEVEAVRAAFEEHNAHLEALGNHSSISDYQRRVALWRGDQQYYRAGNSKQLLAKLKYFGEATDERVEELMDEQNRPDRVEAVKARYHAGKQVMKLISSIELNESMDADLSELLEGLED